jgi:HEAT repeat protein
MNRMVRRVGLIAPAVLMALQSVSLGYIDLAPTLTKIISQSRKITVVEVMAYDHEKHVVTLKDVRALKGEAAAETYALALSPNGQAVANQVTQWAVPGTQAMAFTQGNVSLVCMGEGWFALRNSGGQWKIGDDRPDLPLAYYGSLARLVEGTEKLLAGKDAVITMVPHGAEESASFELALNRQSLPGLVKLQRIRANLTMPETTMAISANPLYLLGQGAVDPAELPALVTKLKSGEATVRAGAAADLRTLGEAAKSAAPALEPLLADGDARVRSEGASALLKIAKDQRGVAVLVKNLKSTDPAVRRDAARAAGLAGAAAEPLAEKLAAMLKDGDEGVRITALQAISILGPAAAKAEPAVEALLGNPTMAVEAADALGRIGLLARPAMKKLAKMLESEDYATQWAGVRAMAQIGGPDSKPAIDFMVKKFASSPGPTEVEGYNMMVYFSLIGPEAKPVLQQVNSAGIKNPVLHQTTAWAIEMDSYLPWQGKGGGRGFGGRGGGPGGMMDLGSTMYAAYVDELGYRLKPAAKLLATKIMDGSAGDVPAYGYKILAAGGEEAVGILAPHLASEDGSLRERAEVALGFMGPAGASARPQLQATLAKAENSKEKLLIAWSLREIGKE